jgi:hypothetical protein
MARVVVIVRGGVVQNVITDTKDTEVLVLDEDCDGCDPEKIQSFFDGTDEFDAIPIREGSYGGYDIVRVDSYFKQAAV